MDEKILIKSEQYSLKKFLLIVLAVSILASVLWAVLYVKDSYDNRVWIYESSSRKKDCAHFGSWSGNKTGNAYDEIEFYKVHPTFDSYIDCMLDSGYRDYDLLGVMYADELIICALPLALNIISVLIWFSIKSYSLTVTDKRVYGNIKFGKQVDLPMDSVTAVATSWLKGISVATSSGRISFALIKNRDEIHKTLSNLIIARQSKPKTTEQKTTEQKTANSEPATIIQQATSADELKKFKDLLDAGVITQEEFDAKKKQILGL